MAAGASVPGACLSPHLLTVSRITPKLTELQPFHPDSAASWLPLCKGRKGGQNSANCGQCGYNMQPLWLGRILSSFGNKRCSLEQHGTRFQRSPSIFRTTWACTMSLISKKTKYHIREGQNHLGEAQTLETIAVM